jgi:hypothetical protein
MVLSKLLQHRQQFLQCIEAITCLKVRFFEHGSLRLRRRVADRSDAARIGPENYRTRFRAFANTDW